MKNTITYEGVDFDCLYDIENPDPDVGYGGGCYLERVSIVGNKADILDMLAPHIIDYLEIILLNLND